MFHKEIFCRIGKAALSSSNLPTTTKVLDADGKTLAISLPKSQKPPQIAKYASHYRRYYMCILNTMGITFDSEMRNHKKTKKCSSYLSSLRRQFGPGMAMLILKANIATNKPNWPLIEELAKTQIEHLLYFSNNKKDQLSLVKAIVVAREIQDIKHPNSKTTYPCECATEGNKTPLHIKYREEIMSTLLPGATFNQELFNFLIDDDFNTVLKEELKKRDDHKLETQKLDDKEDECELSSLLQISGMDLPVIDDSKEEDKYQPYESECLDLNRFEEILQ